MGDVIAFRKPACDAAPEQYGTVLVLRNGFTVTGESACVSAENFDAELGRKSARQNAIDKCWPLFGFWLAARQAGVDFLG